MPQIYWIRLPEHIDIFTQGYVGYTAKSREHRFKKHCERINVKNRQTRLISALKKHGIKNVIVETILIGDEAYCLDVENNLRSTTNIGWNLGLGGSKTTLGRKATAEQRAHFSKVHSGRGHTEEWKKMMSEKFKGRKFRLGTKIIGRKHKKVSCPHCGKLGGGSVMMQWHFDKCRERKAA